jgi:hypothetical protein
MFDESPKIYFIRKILINQNPSQFIKSKFHQLTLTLRLKNAIHLPSSKVIQKERVIGRQQNQKA